jgi:hypothetical protein
VLNQQIVTTGKAKDDEMMMMKCIFSWLLRFALLIVGLAVEIQTKHFYWLQIAI